MDKSASEIWEAALGALQLEVNKPNFDTWLKSTKGLSFQNNVFVVGAPTVFVTEWLQDRLHSLIKRTLSSIIDTNVEVDFQVQGLQATDLVHKRSANLNPKYTFNTFTVGEANRLAYNVAKEFAENLETEYNPLFVFGDTGNGKTHLLHAIGHVLEAKDQKLLIFNGEGFTNGFVWSIKKNEPDKFRNLFNSADVLMVDDVQLLQQKPKTQENLINIFNEMYFLGKKMVFTGDRSPNKMCLNPHLRSRFEGSLVIDIQPLDKELRQAILDAKAKDIPYEVRQFIASLDIDNVRKLEGYLNRVLIYCQGITGTIDLDSVKSALKSVANDQIVGLTPYDIIKAVASHFGISVEALKGGRKDKMIAKPRQVAMFLLLEEIGLPINQVGTYLGNRDHSKVNHGWNQVKNSPGLLKEAEKIKQQIASH